MIVGEATRRRGSHTEAKRPWLKLLLQKVIAALKSMCSLLMQHGLVYTAISTQSSRYTLVRLTCVKASARARAGREELATRLNKNYSEQPAGFNY